MMTEFKVGDQVEIVNYGGLIYEKGDDGALHARDLLPYIIGQRGIIVKAKTTQNIDNYSIDGIPSKTAWYQNDQLELVHRPKYKDV